ncbi:MAG: NACHT domain-containing protein [Rhodoferax sp.]|uniref:NACHT domain-containing protein n=1 Tax=Rhodoferax sp. TaxID=50421 RepID=UPI003BAFF56B
MSYFGEIIKTIGASTLTEKIKSDNWEFSEALFETPVGQVKGSYLYLNSRCNWSEATSTNLSNWAASCDSKGYQVVTAPSSALSSDLDRVARVFRATKAQTTRGLLLDSFGRQLSLGINGQSPNEYFIDPDLELPDGKSVANASSHLAQWLTDRPTKNSTEHPIAVLVADGGVGKTTLARVLCERLSSRGDNAYPVLVESAMWRDVVQSNLQLKVIIERSITNRYENASRLASSEDTFRALFRAGVFVLIFDGFDELCVHPGSTITPKQILEELTELSKIEEDGFQSRIIITTRESYWQSISTEIDTTQLEIFKLRGFDNEKKKSYFQKRLKTSAGRDLAFRLAKQVGGAIYKNSSPELDTADRPSGVPFILDLIARYIEDNAEVQVVNPYEADPLANLLEGICRRENVRQRLGIDPYKQLELFEELFREYEDKITQSDLEIYAEIFCNVRDKETVNRLTNHVFFVNAGPSLLAARYEVLRVYFVARFLSNGLTNSNGNESRKKIANLLAAQSAGHTQVIEALVTQLQRHPRERLIDAIKQAYEIVAEQKTSSERVSSGIALSHIVMALIESQKTRADRTQELAALFGINLTGNGFLFRGMSFSGTIGNLDLSNVTFQNCYFLNVSFNKCKFSQRSIFMNCEFNGSLAFTGCESAGDLQIADGSVLSKEAEYEFSLVHSGTARREVRISLAEDAAVRALRRFKSEFGFVVSQARRMTNGFRPGNPYNEKIWDALLSAGIVERHRIAGVTEGGLNIRVDKEVRREVSDFLDNGVLGGTLRGVISSVVDR